MVISYGVLPLICRTISMGWDSVLNNLPYGDRFRKHRKWLQDAFVSKAALATYLPIQRRETYTLLAGLCDRPELFMEHIKRCVASPPNSMRPQADRYYAKVGGRDYHGNRIWAPCYLY